MNWEEFIAAWDEGRRDFSNVNFSKAGIYSYHEKSINFKEANFTGADLQEANLQYANIESIGIDSSTQFFNEGFTQNSQGQFYPIQESIAEQNK